MSALMVVPEGYSPNPRDLTGPFKLESYLSTVSAVPPEDRALLLNAEFTEGYQVARVSSDGRKRYVVQLFRTGSAKKAKYLQQGFWKQERHSRDFPVPGVPKILTDQRVTITGVRNQSQAVAQASFVSGALLARLAVRQLGPTSSELAPDIALIKTVAKQQYDHLTTRSG